MNSRILMYHAIESGAGSVEMTQGGDLLYVLQVDMFKNHMELLKNEAANIVTFEDSIINETVTHDIELSINNMNVFLTFDDGHRTNYTVAYPLLVEHGYKAAFFITTDWVNNKHYMTDHMLREMHQNGMHIGSHGVSHNFMTGLSNDAIYKEMATSKKHLEDILGSEVVAFSAPGGRIDMRVAAIAAEVGYRHIFTSTSSANLQIKGVEFYDRIPIKSNCDLKRFKNILYSERSLQDYLTESVLTLSKKMLGNKRYESIREFILRATHR